MVSKCGSRLLGFDLSILSKRMKVLSPLSIVAGTFTIPINCKLY
jgi:hypothetical protein